MVRFPEDDEIEQLKEEYADADMQLEDFMRNKGDFERKRDLIKQQIELKQIDPVVKKLVESAKNEGHALGANEALGNRIKFLEKRIEVRDTEIRKMQAEIDEHSDYDEWVESSQEWERKYKQLKNSRRSR